MKLYYSPGALLLLSPHIAACCARLPSAFEPVLASTKKTRKLQDQRTDCSRTIKSEKGHVHAARELPRRLGERAQRRPPAAVQYVADKAPGPQLPAPPTAQFSGARHRLPGVLNFITSEGFARASAGCCSTRRCPRRQKSLMRTRLTDRLEWVDAAAQPASGDT